MAENSGGYVKKNALKVAGSATGSAASTSSRAGGTGRWPSCASTAPRASSSWPTSWRWRSLRCGGCPRTGFALFEVGNRVVHPDGYVQVDAGYYTAPHHLMSQEVKVHWDDRLVRIYHQGRAVRVHLRQHQPRRYTTNPEDRPAHKPARQQAYQELLLAKAERIGSRALAWAKAAVDERDVRAYRLVQGVLALTRSRRAILRRISRGLFQSRTKNPAVAATVPAALLLRHWQAKWKQPTPPDRDPLTGQWKPKAL